MAKVILIFAIATAINVILSTLRSLCTINAGKWVASTMNAICYGFYTWVVVLTVSDIDLWVKILITAIANFVGVFVVKLIEEKAKKDKMWKVEIAIPKSETALVEQCLKGKQIPFNHFEAGSWEIFNCYCNTKAETSVCVSIAKNLNGKISAYESKPLI